VTEKLAKGNIGAIAIIASERVEAVRRPVHVALRLIIVDVEFRELRLDITLDNVMLLQILPRDTRRARKILEEHTDGLFAVLRGHRVGTGTLTLGPSFCLFSAS